MKQATTNQNVYESKKKCLSHTSFHNSGSGSPLDTYIILYYIITSLNVSTLFLLLCVFILFLFLLALLAWCLKAIDKLYT